LQRVEYFKNPKRRHAEMTPFKHAQLHLISGAVR
jgi:hypothetical protein